MKARPPPKPPPKPVCASPYCPQRHCFRCGGHEVGKGNDFRECVCAQGFLTCEEFMNGYREFVKRKK